MRRVGPFEGILSMGDLKAPSAEHHQMPWYFSQHLTPLFFA